MRKGVRGIEMEQCKSWNRSFHRSFLCLVGSVILSCMSASHAVALDLVTPFLLETAQVLPKGIRNPRFSNLFIAGDSRFTGAGGTEPLGNRLAKAVTWDDVISA